LEELIACDTIPIRKESSKMKVISVAELFAAATEMPLRTRYHKSLYSFAKKTESVKLEESFNSKF
jgi:ribose-phosphate pyrophosphokinase